MPSGRCSTTTNRNSSPIPKARCSAGSSPCLSATCRSLGAYEQAADLLTQFAAGQSEEERASTLATQRWFQTMARHPRTSLTKPDGEIRLPLTVGSETVKSPLDGTDKKVHNFYTDITIGGRTERFIFDTGCSGAPSFRRNSPSATTSKSSAIRFP